MEETTGMSVYHDRKTTAAVNRVIVETDSIALLLKQISKWQSIKSTKSTIVLQTKGHAEYRLILGDGEPAISVANGWNQYDVGDFFSDMKAI
jgi:hypothetical protein